MPAKSSKLPPTDEEILSFANVPVDMAARYIGWSNTTIYYALQEERAPFGFAAQNPKTKSWTYNISPGLLVKYKNGELPTYKLKEVVDLAAEGVERVINEKLAVMQRFTAAALGG